MPKPISIEIDGARYRAVPEDAARDTQTARAASRGCAPPRKDANDMDTDHMTDETRDRPFPPMGRFDKHLTAPPQIMGCERLPFLVLVGTVGFLGTLALTLTSPIFLVAGLAACGVILVNGLRWLRAMFIYDPHWFAMRWLAVTWPRHLHDDLPPAWVKRCDFIGYEDPPAPHEVAAAWAKVLAVLALAGGLAGLLFGPLAGGGVFAVLLSAVLVRVFTEDITAALRALFGRA